MTPDELRYNALVLMVANLQRLFVFHRALALIDGWPADPAVLGALRRQMDVVGAVVRRADESRTISAEDVEPLRPIADELPGATRGYYRTDLSGPPRTQAAFGAAAVAAARYMNQGTIRMGEVFGHEEWADRERQHLPRLQAYGRQADHAVRAAADGEPDDEVAGFIREHVRIARADEQLAVAQVDGLHALLDGHDPRDHPSSAEEAQASTLTAFVRDVLAEPTLAGDATWSGYVAIIHVDDGVGASAYRYAPGITPRPSAVPAGALARFRSLHSTMGGPAAWTCCITKLDRRSGRVAVEYLGAEDAEAWRIGPDSFRRIAEALRPRPGDFR